MPSKPSNSKLPRRALIGMVHVGALPGTPRGGMPIDELCRRAATEAKVLAEAGFDALIVENMHDRPYVHGRKGPETVAVLTRVGMAVRAAAPKLPIGFQVLSGGNHEAIAIAQAIGGQFIRCENFVFGHVADEGVLERAEAGPLLRYRRDIGAVGVKVFCDLKKKHAAHAITADVSLAEVAEAAEFFSADGVIVTGSATGKPTSLADVKEVRRATRLPLLVGSGVTPQTVAPLLEHADGLIVGSFIKKGGHWAGAIDPARCRAIVKARR
ncbi:MAG: BtpA/SgcQ family protein [Phycisphaerales bacterium]|nr:BtpA/SgcQ family protein [Phycisphaerales bacterium]